MKNFLEKIKNFVLDTLYPQKLKCILCGRDIPNFDESPFCEDCLKKEIFNTGNKCKICDLQILEGNTVCDFCKDNKRDFEKAYCPLVYEAGVRKMILKFKSDNAEYLAPPLAKLIATEIQKDNIKIDVIIAVPSHKTAIKMRGYNPASLLAKELSQLLNILFVENVVTKEIENKKQKDLNIRDRQTNVANCFCLKDIPTIKDKNVLIVDDIITTGYTINAVAKVLKPHAKHIYVCAIARNELKKDK